MPLVASHDPGNIDGKVHSHRFPGANTAVPYANQDQTQLDATEKFLTSGFITVDIFAVSPVKEQRHGHGAAHGRGAAGQDRFRRGRGSRTERQRGDPRSRTSRRADRPSGIHLEPGSTARVDVVVRTRKIGHFFPGGTVDAFDVWLELQGYATPTAA